MGRAKGKKLSVDGMRPGELAKRIFFSFQRLQLLEAKSISFADLGRRVGKALNRPAYSSQAAGRWCQGQHEPDTLSVVWAIAAVCGVDAGWLAFGDASHAPAPEGSAAFLDLHTPPPSPRARRAAPVKKKRPAR